MANLDVFITKFTPAGDIILYSTFFGGAGDDWGHAIDIDFLGNIILTGCTMSGDIPLQNAYQSSFGGYVDAFVSKLDQTGQSIIFSTLIGDQLWDWGFNIATDLNGDIIMIGHSESSEFPTLNPLQSKIGGSSDLIITKFSSSGECIFSTFLGGPGREEAYGLDIGEKGEIFLSGFIYTPDGYESYRNVTYVRAYGSSRKDAFVAKIIPPSDDDPISGVSVEFLTIIGGAGHTNPIINGSETAYDLSIDISGNILFGGTSVHSDFTNYQGFWGALNATGALMFTTYICGSANEYIHGVTFTAQDKALFVGLTTSADLPVINAFQPTKGAGTESNPEQSDTFFATCTIDWQTWSGIENDDLNWATFTESDPKSLPNYQWMFASLSLATIGIIVTRIKKK